MHWKKKSIIIKKITVDDALNIVNSNYDIVVGLASAEPMDFLNRIHEIKDRVENVNVLTCLNMGGIISLQKILICMDILQTWHGFIPHLLEKHILIKQHLIYQTIYI